MPRKDQHKEKTHMSYPNAAAALQGLRANLLAGFLNFIISDPLHSPYMDTVDIPTLITGLGIMQTNLQNGTLSPTSAELYIQIYVHSWSPTASYYFTTEFVSDLQLFTNIQNGPVDLWSSFF